VIREDPLLAGAPPRPWRLSGRLLVIDPADRLLLVRCHDPVAPVQGEWWEVPGGGVDPGEDTVTAALREVAEETGVRAEVVRKLGDVKYVYTRGGLRIFKVVSFFQLRYRGGRLGEIAPEMRREVAEVRWLPLDEAPRLLAYRGERQMAEEALRAVTGDNL
jgi:8-oxo-dGTP pyrophosphatase MutT (NUDIX family)